MNDDVVNYIRWLEGRVTWLELRLQQSRRLGVDRDAEEAKRQDRLRVAEGHGALRGTG